MRLLSSLFQYRRAIKLKKNKIMLSIFLCLLIKNMYWIYYINEESAKTGISNQILKKGDELRWAYEKSN